MSERNDSNGRFKKKHGMYGTRLYGIWSSMLQRCNNPKAISYKYYGGKGITVCDEWKDASAFLKWAMSNGYSDNLTLDRIDSSKNYCPENCRWITNDEQQRNRCNNHVLEFNGEKHCLAEWGRITGINDVIIGQRLRSGWSIRDTLTIPVSRKNRCRRIYNEQGGGDVERICMQ